MKRIIPIIVTLALLLAGCSALTGGTEQPVSDAQMATRVAQLLSTMTTPTVEIEFPPTSTPLPTMMVITATPEITATSESTATEEMTMTSTATAMTTESATAEAVGSATETATPTITPTVSTSDPAKTLGTATGSDLMDSSTTWNWPTGEDDYLDVEFNNGFLQMTGLTSFAGWRLPLIAQQVNSYIELTANSGACQGKDSYGVIFRVPVFKDPNQGYLYEVTCDGYYRLWKWDGNASTKGLATALIPWAQSSLISAGANQTNRLGVMVKGNTYTLYMNGVALASASDTAYNAGFFGVFVRSAQTAKYTVKFDAMQYWENP